MSGGDADGRMDLLTVVMHELGHVIGFDDVDADDADLMSETLDAGTRQLADDYNHVDPVLSNGTEDGVGLVSMDAADDDSEIAASTLKAKFRQAWLADFLVNGGTRTYNPFDPADNIKIYVDDDEEDEG
jgi:hypothetical protein